MRRESFVKWKTNILFENQEELHVLNLILLSDMKLFYNEITGQSEKITEKMLMYLIPIVM